MQGICVLNGVITAAATPHQILLVSPAGFEPATYWLKVSPIAVNLRSPKAWIFSSARIIPANLPY